MIRMQTDPDGSTDCISVAVLALTEYNADAERAECFKLYQRDLSQLTLLYPQGNLSEGGRRLILHVARVTKSCISATVISLTPSRSLRLCPASANRLAEFIHNPAKPFPAVNATLLAKPSNVIFVPLSIFPELKAVMSCSAPSEWSCVCGVKMEWEWS